MPEVTQIQVLNTVYDIRDATARQRTIPSGGSTNQVLKKNTGNDYDASWQDESGGIQSVTPTTASIGSASAGTSISADDITAWSEGTLPSATVDGENITLTFGSLPSLSYTARTIPNISITSQTVVTDITVT